MEGVLDRKREEKQVRSLLGNYIRSITGMQFIRRLGTLAVEKRFRLQVDGAEVVGKIDRVNDVGDGEVEVVDYKTGSGKPMRYAYEMYFGPELYDVQLALYYLACRDGFDEEGKPLALKPRFLSLWYPKDWVWGGMRQDIFSVGRPAGLKEYREKPLTIEDLERSRGVVVTAIERKGGALRTGPARDRGDMRDALRHMSTYGRVPIRRCSPRMSPTRVGAPVLSPEQVAAAHAGPQGAYLIAAGPGTGKTFTATERFCWLVEQGVAPDQILTVTFSDRAAEELRRRITDELSARRPDFGPQALDGAWIGTFHSVCARLLDEFAYLVGSPRELRVLDETGQRLFEQELVARLRSGATAPFDPDSFAALSVDDLDDLLRSGLRFLLKLKGRGINPERFHERALALHAQNWAGRPAPNGSGGPDPAHAELEAIEVLFIVYSAYEDALHAQGRTPTGSSSISSASPRPRTSAT